MVCVNNAWNKNKTPVFVSTKNRWRCEIFEKAKYRKIAYHSFRWSGTEKHIMESLEIEDPELADEIRKKMFVFEDILLLDDRAIQRVLRDVENADLELALKNTTEEVQNVIYKNLSKRLAAMIKEDMDFMGPVRMKDVEEAQQKIVAVIRKLEDAGEIVISRGGGDDIVV